MRLLLDTHALIWSLEQSHRLSAAARAAIEDVENEVLVSVVSAWEIAIKKSTKRLATPDDLDAVIDAARFIRRDIKFADVRQVSRLPLHHRDPFDRILVAQALEDSVPIVTCDPQIARYQVQIFW